MLCATVHTCPQLNQIQCRHTQPLLQALLVILPPVHCPCNALSLSKGSSDMSGSSCLQAPLVISNPHALPMYRDDQHKRKRKSERDRDDAAKFRKPQAGQSAAQLGRGAGGNIGATGGTLLTQYVLKAQVSLCCVDGVMASSVSVAVVG